MVYLYLFIFIFIILTNVYILINYKALTIFDITLIIISIIILILSLIFVWIKSKKNIECFISQELKTLSSDSLYQIFNSDENIDEININLVCYLSIFNPNSINLNNNKNIIWNNIIKNNSFNLDKPLIQTDKHRGINLGGSNKLTGPLSNNLGIKFNMPYSICIVCKHHKLINENNNDIELFKLYANSANNNAITFYIKNGSIVSTNNVQNAQLLFQYTNSAPLLCLINQNDTLINFDKDILTFYFIIRGTDNIKIITMSENSNIAHVILQANIANNSDITFSNKELYINRNLNWNASLLSFAIYNSAISDDFINKFYNHIMTEYYKSIDPSFNYLLNKYNIIAQEMNAISSCPYDATTCNSCNDITNWNDINQVIHSNSKCKQKINDYCTTNTTNPLCKCWDTKSTFYNTDTCKIFRSIFNNNLPFMDNITPDILNKIKLDYNLINRDDCPACSTNQQIDLSKIEQGIENLLKYNKDNIELENPYTSTNTNNISQKKSNWFTNIIDKLYSVVFPND